MWPLIRQSLLAQTQETRHMQILYEYEHTHTSYKTGPSTPQHCMLSVCGPQREDNVPPVYRHERYSQITNWRGTSWIGKCDIIVWAAAMSSTACPLHITAITAKTLLQPLQHPDPDWPGPEAVWVEHLPRHSMHWRRWGLFFLQSITKLHQDRCRINWSMGCSKLGQRVCG